MKRALPSAVIITLLFCSCSKSPRTHHTDLPTPISFNGTSDSLKATVIIPTLDTPSPTNQNIIWCASFQAAWKGLEDLTTEPISFERDVPAVQSLNSAIDPRSQIPPENLYVAAGWTEDGIIQKIQNDLNQKFPGKAPFNAVAGSYIAYAYLEASIKFPLPFNQNYEPLIFTNSAGEGASITSFGFPRGFAYDYSKPPSVLFDIPKDQGAKEYPTDFEFAVDLCPHSPTDQIVIADVSPDPSLAATLSKVERYISEHRPEPVDHTSTLLVPDLHWFISHRFLLLEGHTFKNQKLSGRTLDIAQEDILFRLDKNGAELRAESYMTDAASKMYVHDLIFNRPFLIYLKKRGAQLPYFAMWVANAELLNKWHADSGTNTVH